MKATRKATALQRAYERAVPGREMLRKLSGGNYRIMEEVDDKAGIHLERWIVGHGPMGEDITQLILWATPYGWEVFTPVTKDNSIGSMEKKLAELLK